MEVEVEETRLPGIGCGTTLSPRRDARNGVRHVAIYDEEDSDPCEATVELTSEESEVLAELLGAVRPAARAGEGLVTEGLPIAAGSPFVAGTLGDTAIRTRTGASVVAVLIMAALGPLAPHLADSLIRHLARRDAKRRAADHQADGRSADPRPEPRTGHVDLHSDVRRRSHRSWC
ncbi:MAG: hypothetical protein M3302_02785 [Actinomycetota bacterium]|nr:hypothetical protein [Actinomycetota bacterium]